MAEEDLKISGNKPISEESEDEDEDEFYTEVADSPESPTKAAAAPPPDEGKTAAPTNALEMNDKDADKKNNGTEKETSNKTGESADEKAEEEDDDEDNDGVREKETENPHPEPRGSTRRGKAKKNSTQVDAENETTALGPKPSPAQKAGQTASPPKKTPPSNNAPLKKGTKAKKKSLFSRPPGRAKKGHDWDDEKGEWVPLPGHEPVTRKTESTSRRRKSEGDKPTKSLQEATTTTAAAASQTSHVSDKTGPARKRAKKTEKIAPPPPADLSKPVLPIPPVRSKEARAAHDRIVTLARKDLWSDNEQTLIKALDELKLYCNDESVDAEGCRRMILETGVHALVVKILERNPESSALQGKGLDVLFHFSASNIPVIEEALLVMGAVEVAVTGMQKFPDNVDVITHAMVLLGNLAVSFECWQRIQEASNSAFASHGSGAETKDNDEEEKGSYDESSAKDGEEAATTTSTTGGKFCLKLLREVFDAMERHTDSEKVQEGAVFFLDRCISVAGPEMVDLLSSSPSLGIGVLLVAQKKFGARNPNLRDRVCWFFKKLCQNI